MSIQKFLKEFVFGIPARGEEIIKNKPGYRTLNTFPPENNSFNQWASSLQVSSGYIKKRV